MLTNPQSFQVISNAFNVFDLVHLFQSPIGNRKSTLLYLIFVICCQKNLPTFANAVKTL